MTPLWIAGTPRTCSQVLCDMLNQTGMFDPIFSEWYNSNEFDEFPKTPPKFCKIFPNQYKEHFGHDRFDIIEEQLPGIRWVYLTRRDKIAQTASVVIANNSGVWNCGDSNEKQKEKYKAFAGEVSDKELIGNYRWLVSMDATLDKFFRTRSHLRLVCEDIKRDPASAARTILGYIGSDGEFNIKPRLAVLENPMREELMRRLRKLIRRMR